MTANELMIGNYVDQGPKYGVLPITPYELHAFALSCKGGFVADYYKDWKPIPITPEWLMKLGFKIGMPDNSDLGWNRETKEVFYGYLYENGGYWEHWTYGNDHDYDWRITTISYVHELQNLFYLLTGERLTIKEK